MIIYLLQSLSPNQKFMKQPPLLPRIPCVKPGQPRQAPTLKPSCSLPVESISAVTFSHCALCTLELPALVSVQVLPVVHWSCGESSPRVHFVQRIFSFPSHLVCGMLLTLPHPPMGRPQVHLVSLVMLGVGTVFSPWSFKAFWKGWGKR